MTKQYMYY